MGLRILLRLTCLKQYLLSLGLIYISLLCSHLSLPLKHNILLPKSVGCQIYTLNLRVYLTNSLKTLDFTGFFSSFILIFNVFSLVFALMSENKGKFCF